MASQGDGYWRGYPDHLLPSGGLAASSSVSESGDQGDFAQASQASAQANFAASEAGASNRVGSQGQARYGGQPKQQSYVYYSGKSHVIAGLLAIFLGFLGIHKFYLGYNSVGFIMLAVTVLGSIFTFGLAGMVVGVIGLVEGIIYLATSQQLFDRTYILDKKEWF